MQQIPSEIGQSFNYVSNYDKLRNKLIRVLGEVHFTKVNEIISENINFEKAYNRLTFYYLLKKLIAFTKHHEGIELFVKGNLQLSNNVFKSRLIRYFNFDDKTAYELSEILLKLVRETKSNNVKSTSHKNQLNEFSFDNEYRCYICGSNVDYIDPDDTSYRTIEHLRPRSLGGNKHQRNLFIACKRCNQVKGDVLTWLEKNVFSIHELYVNHEYGFPNYCSHEDDLIPLCLEERFERLISDEVIFIVTSMYNYKCKICETDNDISDETYIIEKETDDYFHILNLMPICNLCLDEVDKNLINQENYIKRKRITNVDN
ncbi:HNH endonuclease [Aliarcobacter butzleri]|uniref:HNH endonuclease n=1 Tax=Aliarcobacter butzleri TaxID=28197 RepID=UPI002B2429B3|nr:HNH endonuclease [Aliarcobacter butzleri]